MVLLLHRSAAILLLPVVLASLSLPAKASAAAPVHTAVRFHALDDARHGLNDLALAPATSTPLPRRVLSASANPYLRREVFGFAPYWALADNSQWNFNLLSTVAYFGLDVNDDGTFANSGGGWTGWNSADLVTVINKAHANGDRVVVVIKDFRDASINKVLNTAAYQTLITGVMVAIQTKNLDGVNVDFEPSGSPLFPDIPSGITNFMTALSSQVHARWPQAEVSIDTYAGAASWNGGSFRIGELAPVVDAMFVMAYDSVFSNMPGQAGPNAPMTGWTFNDTVDVAQYLTKAPASKIILGVPYYGYRWMTADTSLNATATSGATAEGYASVVSDLTCGHVAFRPGWDPIGQSPWAAWISPSTNDPCGGNHGSAQELYYDDAVSLGLKYDLVNANNLRGTGMWALGYDSGETALWRELALKFATTPWQSLGGTFASAPSVASWATDRLDVFVRGTDNALWHSFWTGTAWSPFESLGGVLASDPGVVSWGPGRLDVFVRGTDNQLWHKVYAGGWSGWEPLGGGLKSGPEAASWSSGRLDVLVQGTDNQLWHKFYGGGWSGWEPLGGVLNSDPGVVSWGGGRIDIFVRGTDNQLWHKFYAGGWSAWEARGGSLTSAPAVSSCAAGHLDVFATGTGSALYQTGYNGSVWSTWQSVGGGAGPWASEPAAVCSPRTPSADVFEQGTDNAIWQSSALAS